MSRRWEYLPGSGWVLAGPAAVVLLPADQGAVAQQLWSVLSEGGGLDAVLDVLTRSGLAAVPTVVVAEPAGRGARLVVRGEARARVTAGADAPSTVSGAGYRTWREEVVAEGAGLELQVPSATPAGAQQSPLPLWVGVVRADLLIGAPGGADSAPADSAPADSADSTPAGAVAPVDPVVDPALTWLPDEDQQPMGEAQPVTEDPAPPIEPPVAEDQPEPAPAADDPHDVDRQYDLLISGHTVLRTVEDAAVRPPEDPDHAQPSALDPPVVPAPDATPPRPDRVEERPRSEEARPTQGPPGLISSLPFDSPGPAGPPAQTPPARQAWPPPQLADLRSGDGPAVVDAPSGVAAPAPGPVTATGAAAPHPDDETGLTVARVAHDPAAVDADGGRLADRAGWLSALICPHGHANPPIEDRCRVCGAPLAGLEQRLVERPLVGRLRFDGPPGVIGLSRSVVVGRKPQVDRVAGDDVPDLLPVPTGDGGVSRSHVRVGVEGWHVTVEDLHTTNGTVVVEPDGVARRLHPGEQRLLVPGCRVVLGDTVSFVLEAQP